MKLLLQWLYPGLNIKRWMLLFSFGLMLLAFGAALVMNYQVFGRIEEEILRLLFVLTGAYSYTFLAAAGIFFVFIGLFFMLWAIRRLVKRFFSLVAPDQESVSRHIVSKWELSRGLKVVAIGGGHGLSMLLRGLKTKTSNISAIVTVADDGGSSGRLREEMNTGTALPISFWRGRRTGGPQSGQFIPGGAHEGIRKCAECFGNGQHRFKYPRTGHAGNGAENPPLRENVRRQYD